MIGGADGCFIQKNLMNFIYVSREQIDGWLIDA
jgi:hypothetical protein